jgi:hypothetical protein
LPGSGVNDNRRFWSAPPELFEEPYALNRAKISVKKAQIRQAVGQERLGFLDRRPVDHAVSIAGEDRADGLGQIRVLSDY